MTAIALIETDHCGQTNITVNGVIIWTGPSHSQVVRDIDLACAGTHISDGYLPRQFDRQKLLKELPSAVAQLLEGSRA